MLVHMPLTVIITFFFFFFFDHHILELEGCLVVSQTGASQTAVHTVSW